jgi:hypothetical protein
MEIKKREITDGRVIPETVKNQVSRVRKITSTNGQPSVFKIIDQIAKYQIGNDHKVIVFQKIEFADEGATEYRLGYYMFSEKKNSWVWGQSCLMIPEIDLKSILNEANNRRWFAGRP